MPVRKEDFSFQRRLEREADHWFKDGIIDLEQKNRILERYRVLQKVEEKAGPGKLITTLSILGSILVGIGIILFIASNWSAIPRWAKLFIIFCSLITSYGLGFYFRYEKKNYPKVGASLFLLGSFIFGAGIFLIAQIYHIKAHQPNGLLIWGLGVLPLAYFLRFRSMIFLVLVALLVWLGMEASSRMSYFEREGVSTIILLFWMAGLTLWAIGLWHRGWKSLETISTPFILLGALITFLIGFLLTFFRADFSGIAIGMQPNLNLFLTFYPGLILLFLIAMILRCVAQQKERGWMTETVGLFVLIGIAFALSFHFQDVLLIFKKQLRLFLNLLFILEIVGIIFLGFIRRYSIYVNIGLLFFSLDVFARYFDFFWELLPRSLFFILGGLLLLFGGILLERKRRKILASFQLQEV